jgi:hypothetical protein
MVLNGVGDRVVESIYFSSALLTLRDTLLQTFSPVLKGLRLGSEGAGGCFESVVLAEALEGAAMAGVVLLGGNLGDLHRLI